MNRKRFIKFGMLAVPTSLVFPEIILSRNTIIGKKEPQVPKFKPNPSVWKTEEINIAWIGHSTILINFYGKVILTDPAMLAQVGVNFLGLTFGPERYTYPALEISEIPKPDVVIISHAHMDHMDYATLSEIAYNFVYEIDCITACNTKDVIENLDWK
ncbi:MAG TPA: MBL fold metallo-hydrolase [Ignavibacteriaceae bacterium]|nr:MBL fold metallo-hydrolase [Ignavibacteriaceae bacterium]